MLTVKYEDLNNENFNEGLRRIDGHTGFPVKTTFRISRICDAVTRERKRIDEVYKKLLKEYCEKDEKGEIKTDGPFRQPKFIADKKSEYDEKFKELMNTEFQIKAIAVKLSELDKVGLTPAEMAACSAILDFEGEDAETAVPVAPPAPEKK